MLDAPESDRVCELGTGDGACDAVAEAKAAALEDSSEPDAVLPEEVGTVRVDFEVDGEGVFLGMIILEDPWDGSVERLRYESTRRIFERVRERWRERVEDRKRRRSGRVG